MAEQVTTTAYCPMCGTRGMMLLHQEHWKCMSCGKGFLIYVEDE